MSTVNVIEEKSWSIPSPINTTVTEHLHSDELIWICIFLASIIVFLHTFLKSKT